MNIHGWIARNNRANGGVEPESRSFFVHQTAPQSPVSRVERRVFVGDLELRASPKGSGPGLMVGYAAKYDKLSQDLGGFFEKLAPGCFRDVMEDDCRCLRNHDDDNLLGRVSAGTLELSLDDVGLRYQCDLPDTTCGRDTAELIRRRDMKGSSFQFNIAMDGADWDWDGPSPLRTITRIGKLYDVSPVTNPAYLDTDVDMRSFQAALEARNAVQAAITRRSLSLARARLRLAEASYL
jgi:HK97 family phage prohead protease